MKRTIVTFALGSHVELLDIALPTFDRYAQRHGYELRVAHGGADAFDVQTMSERPASWLKVPLLRNLLDVYDEVLWLDADVVIVDDSEDIAGFVPVERWQALAMHYGVRDGLHPNCGVWLVRRPMIPILERLWGMREYLDHVWWEQAAMHELLGFNPHARPVRLLEPTPLYARTTLLTSEWNYTPGCANTRTGRFLHAAGPPVRVRAELMKGWANAQSAA